MPSRDYLMKVDRLKALYVEELQKIVNSKEDFRTFLNFQAKLYKYNFEDTLLIYGQNPNANAVATCDQWNKIGRKVHKGVTAIRAFTDRTRTEMKYIHDLSNTYGSKFTYPIIFTIPEKFQDALVEKLNGKTKDQYPTNDFVKLFKFAVEQYVTDNYQAFYDSDAFQNDKKGTMLERLNRDNTTEIFKATVVDCVGYMLCEKFGIPQGIYGNDELSFIHLNKFDDKEVLEHLLTVANFMGKQTIIQVNTILNEERTMENERNRTQNDERPIEQGNNVFIRGLSNENARGTREDSRSPLRQGRGDSGGNNDTGILGRTPEIGQIRQNVFGLHEGTAPIKENNSPNIGTLADDLRTSAGGSPTDDGTATRTIQSQIPTSNGEIHGNTSMGERTNSVGRGNSVEGNRIRDQIEDGQPLKAGDNVIVDGVSYTIQSIDNDTGKISLASLQGGVIDTTIGEIANKIELIEDREPYQQGSLFNGESLVQQVIDDYADEHERKKSFIITDYIECANGIESTIKANYNGTHLNADTAKIVIGEFGLERVNYVLANTIQQKDYDGRFSTENKAWAKTFDIPQADDNYKFVVDTHPTVLDGFTRQVRKEIVAMLAKEEPQIIKEEQSISPKPMFFIDFKDIQPTLDFTKYQDGDVIGYNKDGVKYQVGKLDDKTYISTTTSITPWGQVLGNSNIPEDILKQIDNYRKGIYEPPITKEIEPTDQPKDGGENDWEKELLGENNDISTKGSTKAEKITTDIFSSNATNFIITNDDDIGVSSGKTKFNNNIEAIKLLQTIESENRIATPEEQNTLAKYSGFGGIPEAFDPDNKSWEKEYNELKSLLTQKEYDLAGGSTLNAHYTSTEVIKAMYKGLEEMGFKGGNVLDPSMGTGYFFGMLPENIKDNTRLYGVELDEMTGRIAKQLYPKANIQVTGFETSQLQDNFFDVAVGNVPFGNYKVNDPKYNKHNFLIHDYFIAKSLDKVQPEGVVAVITSKGTMDKENSSFREYLAQRAELLGAIKLPNTAFKEVAGTEVTTDILFLKKRNGLISDISNENWVNTGKVFLEKENKNQDPTEPSEKMSMPLNQYFMDNPHMMLGEFKAVTGRFGYETALLPSTNYGSEKEIEARFKERFSELRENHSFSEEQLTWLRRFENSAVENKSLNADTFLTGAYFNQFGYSAFNRLSDIFDGKLGELLKTINRKEENLPPRPLNELLNEAISFLPKNVITNIVSLDELEKADTTTIPADPNVKNFAHVAIDDVIYQRENAIMVKVDVPQNQIERVKGLIELRDMAQGLLDIQLDNCSDNELAEAQEKLSNQYDNFVKKFGYVSSAFNNKYFNQDVDYPLLTSLEIETEDKEIKKADIFSKRTVSPIKKIDSVETAVEALAVSMNEYGYVNLPYMMDLLRDRNKTPEDVIKDLEGIIFKNPIDDSFGEYNLLTNWETGDEYLTGNVVEKLAIARKEAKNNPIYEINVTALEQVQPTPLQAHEIVARIGSSWIDKKYYEQFISETLKTPRYERFNVTYTSYTGNWKIEKPHSRHGSIEATDKFGTKRMDAYELMEQLLNQKNPRIFDYIENSDGTKKQVPNKEETIAIRNKATSLKAEFSNWIFKDHERRQTLVAVYNEKFNSTRPRQFNGEHLTFPGMSPNIKLRTQQINGIARALYGGNTLFAHVVGSGKTFTCIAAAMEMKRLGLANKPCITVPNHLVKQWSNDFKKLYPNANILATTEKDFEKKNRQRFCAKIATGNWDAVIISHSQFEKIPMSVERQEMKLRKDIDNIQSAIEELKYKRDERVTVKELQRQLKSQEANLKKLNDLPRDNVINFEKLGVDALFVDEAHSYKNKFMFTKMTNITGLSRTASKKSSDMDMKVEYINEMNSKNDKHSKTFERGVCFATGTPVSNSMTELFTMQTYLQRKQLERLNLGFFDNWAANFGETITSLELAPSGQGFRMRDRFARFVNLPELMGLYRQIADIQTADMLDLPVPKIKGGKPIVIAVEPSPEQEAYVMYLVEMSEKISKGEIKPEVFNMLCVVNEGKLCALDMRTLDPTAEDYAGSKVNACVNNVFDIYQRGNDNKQTQMIFCDSSTPKEGRAFSVYDDIKAKLVAKGVPEEEIAFIHTAKTNEQKEKMFAKVRSGEIRILLGSTSRMGSGTNAQTRLVALHQLDCPYRPAETVQTLRNIRKASNTVVRKNRPINVGQLKNLYVA